MTRRTVAALLGAALIAAAVLVVGANRGDDGTGGAAAVDSAGAPAMFVNMLGSSDRYALGRYVNGEPEPIGPVAESRCDLWGPSVTRARGRFWLYAAESDCTEWQRIVLFTSENSVEFEREGTVIRRRAGEGQLRMPYVVFDRGVFHAWYTVDRGGRQGQALRYAESPDGVHFRRFPGARATAEGLGHGAMTVDIAVRDSETGSWSLLYTGFSDDLKRARPSLMSFSDPRQRHYEGRGPVGMARNPRARLLAPAAAGERELRIAGDRFERGDPVVVAAEAEVQPDPSRVRFQRGDRLVLESPLRFDHRPGDPLTAADATKISPSYVCRAGGRWLGLFTLFGSPPRVNGEFVAAFGAKSLSGPFEVDRSAPFPALSPDNGEFKRSVENPTPVTRGAGAQRCPARLRRPDSR